MFTDFSYQIPENALKVFFVESRFSFISFKTNKTVISYCLVGLKKWVAPETQFALLKMTSSFKFNNLNTFHFSLISKITPKNNQIC